MYGNFPKGNLTQLLKSVLALMLHIFTQQMFTNLTTYKRVHSFRFILLHSLGNFKDPKQSKGAQYTDAEGHSRPEEAPDDLKDTADNNLHI